MRRFLNDETANRLDAQKKAVLQEMERVGVDSEDYPKLLKYLEALSEVEKTQSRPRVSSDTIASVIGSLLGIFIVVAYEQRHVMQTRALNLLPRIK